MYTAQGRLDNSATLKQYSPLVRRLAHQMIAKLPANVELDDMIQAGMIGLNDALGRFDAAQGVQFETFATQRIRGAMLDELRSGDWMSRGNRKQQRQIEAAVHKLEQQFGRAPAESEIAAAMGVSLAEYQDLLGKVRGTQLLYLEDISGGGDGDDDYLDRHVAAEDANPLAHAAGPPHARSAGRGHQAAARTRAVRDEHVLRTRHEPEGNRRRARGDRIARVPTAQPEHRASSRQAARALTRPRQARLGGGYRAAVSDRLTAMHGALRRPGRLGCAPPDIGTRQACPATAVST